MTEELAATDAYRRETTARVTDVKEEGIVLDRTVFYPRGGGQPGDTGTLQWDGGAATVTDTYKRGGVLFHVTEDESPAVGRRRRPNRTTRRTAWCRRRRPRSPR